MAKRERIKINSAFDLEDIMCDMFDEFVQDVASKKGMTRKPDYNYDGSFAYEVGFIYTQKAMNLFSRYEDRMKALHKKHFPAHNLRLISGNLIFP